VIQLPARVLKLLTGCSAMVALLASVSLAQEPVYQKLLKPPSASDGLSFTGSVTADLVTGEILVTDVRNNRILIFDSEGIFRFQINGGDVFGAPLDVAVDPQGFLLVIASFQGKRALIELDFDGLFLRAIEFNGIPEGLPEPGFDSIALSPSGERIYLLDRQNLLLWIADRNGEVQAVTDLADGLSEEERINVILRHVDAYADTVLIPFARTGQVGLFGPEGELRKEVGRKGAGPCNLGLPTAAALDADGNLLIVDQQRSMIVRWSVADNRCLGDYYGIGAAPGYLYYPSDITLDGQGRLYVSQGFQGRVQVYEGVRPAAGWDQVEPNLLPEGAAASEPNDSPPR
jgi:DNA-binding beta-propeller fold protein YncE